MSKKIAGYGSWPSPITSDAILDSGAIVDEVFVDPITSVIYHIERRPSEGGRNVIVKTEEGTDVVGKEWNTRTGVQEYGGAPAIAYNGTIYFSNFADSRVYATRDGGQPEAITPEDQNHRFAKFDVHPVHTHLLAAILEDHTNPLPADVVTTLCTINSRTSIISPLLSGADFYANPCFSPDGRYMAWQQWSHPDMSWEGAEIYVARVVADQDSLTLHDITHIAGRMDTVSALYPIWVSDDMLLFTSDDSGYQNPWTYSVSTRKATPVLPNPVELDFSSSQASLAMEWGAVLDREQKSAIFASKKGGRSILYVVNLQSGTLEEVECPYVAVSVIKRVTHDAVVFLGEKTTEPMNIVLCTLKDYSKPHFSPVKASAHESKIPHTYISVAQPLTLQVLPANEPLHVIFYPPTHPEYVGLDGERPPCVVRAHGGPTSHSSHGLSWLVQYFTSRGWAWLDVDYGGSDGYGRKYMDRLRGNWGVVDVQDCVRAAQQLSAPPYSLVDSKRCVIRGQSSGGFTALAIACTYPQVFGACASLYGISDLRKLVEGTHKLESHYMEKLLGGTLEDKPQVYADRSPILHADKIESPLLVLQGSIDAVVPPEQSEAIVSTIKSHGGHVEYVVFEGEGHGWRKAENIKTSLEKELDFYERVFGLAKAG
ncbi:Alpha/Beta hydrolase protein [Amylocystis lapponica]|nr:Alpha/Beta hydrolase protein [Amylocystis lapponica]